VAKEPIILLRISAQAAVMENQLKVDPIVGIRKSN